MVKEVEALIKGIPAWSKLSPSDEKGRRKVMAAMKKLSQYDLNVLRKAMENFIAKKRQSRGGYDVDDMSRLFILNRYLFNVPDKVPIGAPHFGAFAGVPSDAHSVNDLWPLSFDASGKLILSGNFAGYFGDDYLALEEFDHFAKKYGARHTK
jgi:hypothetical protein